MRARVIVVKVFVALHKDPFSTCVDSHINKAVDGKMTNMSEEFHWMLNIPLKTTRSFLSKKIHTQAFHNSNEFA